MSTPRAKVEEIAFYLGPPWKFNRSRELSDWYFEVIDGTGRALNFRVDKQKFRITGSFPRGRTSPHQNDYKTIGVSLSRPAKDIAADAMRRLIPKYLAAYDRAISRYKVEQEKETRLTHMAQCLVKATGGKLASYSRSGRTIYFKNGDLELWSDEEITLELRKLSIEQTIRIVAMLCSS